MNRTFSQRSALADPLSLMLQRALVQPIEDFKAKGFGSAQSVALDLVQQLNCSNVPLTRNDVRGHGAQYCPL